jgi:DnaJ-class molecular chaperone
MKQIIETTCHVCDGSGRIVTKFKNPNEDMVEYCKACNATGKLKLSIEAYVIPNDPR